jgi:8-oxo-dGTP pyrophosphatase MutT (NUDIX family)
VARSAHRLRVEHLVSAGGVVYRRGAKGLEIVLCGRRDGGIVWGLPKGTPIAGESLEDTARREVTEETGFQVEIEQPLGSIDYWFSRPEQGVRFHKRVHHFLMVPIGGSVEAHDHEYDVVEWYPAHDALDRLAYRNEAEVVQRAMDLLPDGHASGRSGVAGRPARNIGDRRRPDDTGYRRRDRSG